MLKTKRLNLRPFRAEDLSLLFSLHANEEVAKTTIDGVQTLQQVQKNLSSFITHQEKFGYSQWAVFEDETNKFIGRAGLTTRALNKEIGEQTEIRFAFLPEFWGKGYASEIALALVSYGFKNLKLKTLAASTGLTNQKSDRILTKCGFKFVDKIIPEGYGTSNLIRYYTLNK